MSQLENSKTIANCKLILHLTNRLKTTVTHLKIYTHSMNSNNKHGA